MNSSTIAAIATPGGAGGIGIVKLSGPQAAVIAKALFSPAQQPPKTNYGKRGSAANAPHDGFNSHRLSYGHIIDPDTGRMVDEVLLSFMKAPRSYTREDVVEINAHGGRLALNTILELVVKHGARLAEPGEFTQRAFLNGRIDLTQAEAVIDIINARSDKSLQIATAHVDGRLRQAVEQIREILIAYLTRIEAAIDFPDDVEDSDEPLDAAADIEARVAKALQDLIQNHIDGQSLRDGLKISVIGRPNVGKSSLLNRLIQRDRAIVTPIPGTTRDMIEETLNIQGYPIILTDTAGLHDTDDLIENLGMGKTIENLSGADLVLFMVEANRPVNVEDTKIFERIHAKPVIVVINKIDLVDGNDCVSLPAAWTEKERVYTSALYDRGIDRLKVQIVKTAFGKEPIDVDAAIVPNLRQKILLETSLGAASAAVRELKNKTPMELVTIHLQEAIDSLGQILGANVKVDLLDQIFSRFCIGK